MRKPLIAGNWKMNMTDAETKKFLDNLKSLEISDNVEACIISPFTSLKTLNELLKDTDISTGAQNMYYEDSGAFTGEISPNMLKDLGVDYVIIGHSERRTIFKEDDELLNKKIIAALSHNLKPILCCGENLEQRENKIQEKVVENQIRSDLKGITEKELYSKLVIAYEPIWAIGTGKTASSDDAQSMCKFIRNLLTEMYSEEFAHSVRIQYGGSVKPENVAEIMSKDDIDGALVGGASLDTESFSKLINYEK
ncbi:triose-phosphate isomerase [uncultured Finegoldia sp.]|uniref:triose-phosphate isomerase n=1 Tax=uncultured Finegoldia sp. TaxID=328009 RepID=UPI0025E23777|nr:triose-phosphate isomerase [uncultured Finegoldia sp.]